MERRVRGKSVVKCSHADLSIPSAETIVIDIFQTGEIVKITKTYFQERRGQIEIPCGSPCESHGAEPGDPFGYHDRTKACAVETAVSDHF